MVSKKVKTQNQLLAFLTLALDFIFSIKTLEGLKLGTKCSSMTIAVFLEMFLATFLALFLFTKLPKPLTYIFSPVAIEFFTTLKKASTVICTSALSIPVWSAIWVITSALVTFYLSFSSLKNSFTIFLRHKFKGSGDN